MAEILQQQVVGTVHTYHGVQVKIGDAMTDEQLNVLPQGSVVNLQTDAHYALVLAVKGLDGRWHRVDNDAATQPSRDNHLWAVPEGVLGRQETIEEYKHRFHAKVLAAAERQLGRNDADVAGVLGRLGLPTLGVSEGVSVAPDAEVPDGTTVMAFDPAHPEYQTWTRVDGGWRTTGRRPVPTTLVMVVSSPRAEIRTEPRASDAADIAAFKAKAWAEGWALKRRKGWCGAYEQVMRDVGLTAADSLPDFSAFAETDAWRDLPTGALLGYVGHSRWDMAVRDDHQNSGLRRVAGTSTGGLARNRWRVLYDGRGPMRIRFPTELLGLVPPGCTIDYNGNQFTKAEDHLWHRPGDEQPLNEYMLMNYEHGEGSFLLTGIGS